VTVGDHVDAVLEEQLHGLQVALLLVLAGLSKDRSPLLLGSA